MSTKNSNSTQHLTATIQPQPPSINFTFPSWTKKYSSHVPLSIMSWTFFKQTLSKSGSLLLLSYLSLVFSLSSFLSTQSIIILDKYSLFQVRQVTKSRCFHLTCDNLLLHRITSRINLKNFNLRDHMHWTLSMKHLFSVCQDHIC